VRRRARLNIFREDPEAGGVRPWRGRAAARERESERAREQRASEREQSKRRGESVRERKRKRV